MKENIEVIKKDFPARTINLLENLQLLKETIGLTMDEIKSRLNEVFESRDFMEMNKYRLLAEEGDKYEKFIIEIIELLKSDNANYMEISDSKNPNIQEQQRIPNYSEFQVNNQVENNLTENFMHKRPFGFKFIKDDIIEARTWNDLFIKTCEILYEIDKAKFIGFESLKYMNGKKKKYFAKDQQILRKPIQVAKDIFVETNHSANTFRDIIVKMLKEYRFKVSDYKVYLWADYTELNRRRKKLL